MVALSLAVAAGAAFGGPWRSHEVYRPAVERHFVVNAVEHELRYNHDSSVAWFRDRWFCLWNANQTPAEGKPGQLNYVSTSPDGRTWSEPKPAFSSEARSENPIPCPQGTQWQPNLIIVDDELWAIWSQNSRDEHVGCYFSRLTDPDGQWVNRRLLWDDQWQPEIDGKRFRLFPTQNPYRLRSGRILAPVTMIGPKADDAPESVPGWWAYEKRDSVIYTDDGGETWLVSPGAVLPDATWAQWEPTVWELEDGTVMMFARNNDFRDPEMGGPRATEALVWSASHDGGATWTPHRYVPLETVVSRMHVLPAGGSRFMMVHNDWPAGQFVHDRRNLALFFTRDAGIDFIAGPSLTEHEPFVMYPQMWIRDDTVVTSYSQGNLPRSIKVAIASPLPDPDRHYIFPRSNLPQSPVPRREAGALAFNGTQYVEGREVLALGEEAFSAGAWIRADGDGTLLDSRTTNPQAGVLWGLAYPEGRLSPYFFVGSPERNLMSSLEVRRADWNYVGLSVDHRAGTVVFHVNGETEQLSYTKPANPLKGTTAYIGYKRFEGSRVRGFQGLIRRMVVASGSVWSAEAHYAARAVLSSDVVPSATQLAGGKSALFLDPVAESFARDFELPQTERGGVTVVQVEEQEALRFAGEASAGLDLDENRRDRDAVRLRFRFRLLSGEEHVLCTVGDALEPARLVARSGYVYLEATDQEVSIGRVIEDGWTSVEVITFDDRTRATMSAAESGEVRHDPVATWIYLGQGYRTGRVPGSSAFVVDVESVESRVERQG